MTQLKKVMFSLLMLQKSFVYIFRIILEAAYSLYDRAFFDNLATILLMAVVVSLMAHSHRGYYPA